MNKYRVCGNTSVVVTIEVNARSEAEAYEKALRRLPRLSDYAGNGGTDKLVGVDGWNESGVYAENEIRYDDIELLGPADDEGAEDENDE